MFNQSYLCNKLVLFMKKLQRPRDKGKFIPGQIIKGSSEPKLTAPSIPSKNKQQIKYKHTFSAFGASSLRFSSNQLLRASIGPGTYQVNNNPENPSFSKKGFGSMLSKMSKSVRLINKGPGPAFYNQVQKSFLNKETQKHAPKFPKSVTQGMFYSLNKNRANDPGPFEYNQLKTTRASNISSSCFKSSIRRWKQKIMEHTPSPTTYNPKQTLVSKRSRGIVIQQSKGLSKQSVIQSLFGKQKQWGNHNQQFEEKLTTRRMNSHAIANLGKISSIKPHPNYKQFLQANITARSRGYSKKDYNSELSLAKTTF